MYESVRLKRSPTSTTGTPAEQSSIFTPAKPAFTHQTTTATPQPTAPIAAEPQSTVEEEQSPEQPVQLTTSPLAVHSLGNTSISRTIAGSPPTGSGKRQIDGSLRQTIQRSPDAGHWKTLPLHGTSGFSFGNIPLRAPRREAPLETTRLRSPVQRECTACEEEDEPLMRQVDSTVVQRDEAESSPAPDRGTALEDGTGKGSGLDPQMQAIAQQLEQQLEQQLIPETIQSALGQIDLSGLPITDDASNSSASTSSSPNVYAKLATPLARPSNLILRQSAPQQPDPPSTAGSSSASPRTGSAGDVLRSLAAVPEIKSGLATLQTLTMGRFTQDWTRLSTGEQIGFVSTTVVIGAGTLTGILSNPEARRFALDQLNGKVLPVPGVNWLRLELNTGGNNLMLGMHLDVGRLLPPSLGFGSSSPNAIGGPPQPEPLPGQRMIQRQEDNAEVGAEGAIAQRIQAASGSGSKLDEGVQQHLEQHLGADLSSVRIHTDGEADRLSKSVNAVAFTTGQDIFFSSGSYNPTSKEGQHLIAHEAVHTVQQANGAVAGTPTAGGVSISSPSDPFEQEAEQIADRVMQMLCSNSTVSQASQSAAPGRPSQTAIQPKATLQSRGKYSQPASDPVEQNIPAVFVQARRSTQSAITSIQRKDPPQASMPEPQASFPPAPAPKSVIFEGVTLALDASSLRRQLEQIVVMKGQAETSSFAYRFINMTPEQKIQMQLAGHDPKLVGEIQTLLQEEILKLEYDNKEFAKEFEKKATQVTQEILNNSEKQIKKELEHYGITEKEIQTTEMSITTYSMDNKEAGKDLKSAAAKLAKKRREVNKFGQASITARGEVEKYAKDNPFIIPENLTKTAEDKRLEWLKYEDEYHQLCMEKQKTFPILASYSTGENAAQGLEQFAAMSPDRMANSIGVQAAEKLRNIQTIRSELGKKYNIWTQSHIINVTKQQMNATSMQSRILSDEAAKIQAAQEDSKMLFTIIAIGLGLLAAIPTGGSSVLAATATIAAVGGAALSLYGAYEHLREYSLESAANGTDFDKAKAISQEEPSMLWLALDVVTAIGDIAAAAAAFKVLKGAMQAAKADRAAHLPDVINASRKAGLSPEAQGRVISAAIGDGSNAGNIIATLEEIAAVFNQLEAKTGANATLAKGFQKASDKLIKEKRLLILPSEKADRLKKLRAFLLDVQVPEDELNAERIILVRELNKEGSSGIYYSKLNIVVMKGGGSSVDSASVLAHELAHETQNLNKVTENLGRYEKEFQAFTAQREFLKLLPDNLVPTQWAWLRGADNARIEAHIIEKYPTAIKPDRFSDDEIAEQILKLLRQRK